MIDQAINKYKQLALHKQIALFLAILLLIVFTI